MGPLPAAIIFFLPALPAKAQTRTAPLAWRSVLESLPAQGVLDDWGIDLGRPEVLSALGRILDFSRRPPEAGASLPEVSAEVREAACARARAVLSLAKSARPAMGSAEEFRLLDYLDSSVQDLFEIRALLPEDLREGVETAHESYGNASKLESYREAQGWLLGRLPSSDARDFYGLDLTRPREREAFLRAASRAKVAPENLDECPIGQRPEFVFHSIVGHSIEVMERLLSEREAGTPQAPGSDELALQVRDLLLIMDCLPELAQGVIEKGARALKAHPLMKPLLEELDAKRRGPGLDELLGMLGKGGREIQGIALGALDKLKWTPEMKDRLRRTFLAEDSSPALRRGLLEVFEGPGFGKMGRWRILEWLYPDLMAEIERAFPRVRDFPFADAWFSEIASGPRSLREWASQARDAEIRPRDPGPEASGGTRCFFEEGYRLPYALGPGAKMGIEGRPEPSGGPRLVRLGPGRNAAVEAIIAALRGAPGAENDSIFFDGTRFWLHASLDEGSADLYLSRSGALRLRCRVGGEARLKMISSFLGRFPLSVKPAVDGLTAVWESRPEAESAAFVLKFLHDSGGMAPLLGEAGPEALAGVYLGEGRWPFPAEVEGFRAYEALKPRREALREGISRELERLGLAPFPEGAPFGQRTIDLRFDRPLREAEAKGEIVRSIGSAPNRAYSFPLDDLALSALRRTWESMKAASVLSSFDLPGLDLRPFGEIGALRAERGSLALPGGSILAVLALRDPGSGALAFAEASLWNPEQGKKALGPGELKGILLREGFPSAGEEAFGLRQKERLLDLLWESRGFELGERRLGFGVVLSRGPEGSSTGRVVFDPAEAGPGLVAALPGEGSFPRVPGAASARIPSARWGWELGRRVLVVPSWRRGKPKMGPGGLQMSGLIPSGDLVLREGDWIRASRGGEVELAARFGPDILAAAWALERIRSGASQDLEWLEGWGPEVEDFIYSEAVWNPVYAGKRFRILDRLKALSKGPAVFEWGASRDGAFGRSSWPEAQAHARRPLWTRLEARLGKAADKSGLLRVLRRMLRRDFGGRPLLKLVFVCTGNTCRSPMAEQMSRELFEREGIDGVEVLSAGFLSALFEDGMSPLSAEAMAGLGFHPRPHAARELGPELVRSADFILAMEDVHVWAILRRFPEAASKVMLFSEFAGLGMKPIPDPVFRARPEPLGPEEGFSEAMAMNLEARGRRAPSLDSLSYSYGEAASAILLAVEGAARRLKSLRRLIEIDAKAREDKLARVSAARPPLLGLDAIDGDFASVAGEEAAALSEAALAARAAGARVAGGFALTAWAFEEFLRENGALDASRGLGREIRDALDARGLGGRLELRFCGERLSASPGNLLDKVAEAWGRRPGSAVLIAALPEGGASAVACTRHPAGREGEIAIDASRGGGHWDRYAASAEDGSEVEPAIHPWGPRVLSREQTRRISLLASALREHMGRDLEIELSLRGGAVEVLSVGTYRP